MPFRSLPAERGNGKRETRLSMRFAQKKQGGKSIGQPIVFNITYTPYRLPRNATSVEIAQHRSDRAFYDMSGEKNIYKYISTEAKRSGKMTALEYFQKSTGVFNGNGFFTQEGIEALQKRAQTGEKNLWHGFISVDEENSHKIDTPQKCMRMIKRNFPTFFKEMGLDPNNVDLMCALHMDRPKHLHLHFLFFEKEPKCKYRKKELEYRHKGKIAKDVLDKMHVRLTMWLADDKERLPKSRDEAIGELRRLSGIGNLYYSNEDICKEILSLAKDLPKGGRCVYGSKDMKPYRERVDKIVNMLIVTDKRARKADLKFYETVAALNKKVKETCKGSIEEKNIALIDDVEYDYKRRQGNLVLRAALNIKPEIFERKPRGKYRVNDNSLKRSLAISEKIVEKMVGSFLTSFAESCEMNAASGMGRLREIEEEMKAEHEKEQQAATTSTAPARSSRWNEGK